MLNTGFTVVCLFTTVCVFTCAFQCDLIQEVSKQLFIFILHTSYAIVYVVLKCSNFLQFIPIRLGNTWNKELGTIFIN